ncbi:MBL fold metallo-hydrolase [Fulvivirga lutimaris]|uniref:MBL fold metallo-hydrolase n=1 Tax=Fulvivirga lutimaris TaxID=1819566 RepID=UPI0012BCD2B5|nr:MBL fold metallo-hydrolase [Fulvivirga lutimaris]MTI39722.1 MBL fold metallo-hydrolase [Fulvivirga lutimaris]
MISKTKSLLIFSFIIFTTQYSQAVNAYTDFVVTPITKNIYSIVSPSIGLPTPENEGWNSNIHFVVTENGVLLFDTGSSEVIGNKIKKAIQSITDQPVRWVINSHSHADHWLGNAAFAGVEIIATTEAMETMKKYGNDDVAFYHNVTNGTIGITHLVYPNLLLKEPLKRNFGGVEVELLFANNGHSPGDILMWLPEQKVMIGGDVLSSDYMPMITDHGDIDGLINTLNLVVQLNPSIVLTGHGSATTMSSVIRDSELLTSVWEQVKLDHKSGHTPVKTLSAVSVKLSSKYEPLYKDFTTQLDRHVKLMYQLKGENEE